MKKKIISTVTLLVVLAATSLFAQNEVKLQNVECYNLGDGRYFCRDKDSEKPLEGKSKIIDGYTTQYIEVEFKGGIPNGSWKTYKYNALVEEYTYEDGILNGAFKEYYSDGTTKEIRNYVKGKPEGKFIKYSPQNKVESEKSYKNGLEDGPDIVYDNEGNIRLETYYKAGKAEGKTVKKYDSYTLTAFYKNGVFDGDYAEIFSDGTIKAKGKYVNAKKEGTWEYGKKGGKKTQTDVYSNGDKIKETIYYTDNTVEIVRELKNGKKNGYERKYNHGDGALKSELYYKDGQLASADASSGASGNSASGMIKQTKEIASNQGNFIKTFYEVNGKLEGEYTEQYAEGNRAMKLKGQYSKGLKQGLWVYFDQYGEKEKEENYVDNKLNGKVIKYSGKQINKSVTYKDDTLNGPYEDYRYGKVSEKGTYVNGRVEGKRTYYYPNGKPSTEEVIPHNPNDPRTYKEYYETGVLREEGSRTGASYLERKQYYENGKLESYGKDEDGRFKILEKYDETGKKM